MQVVKIKTEKPVEKKTMEMRAIKNTEEDRDQTRPKIVKIFVVGLGSLP